MTGLGSEPRNSLDERIQQLSMSTVCLAKDHDADRRACQALELLGDRWQSPRLPVVVVGEVSRGKSTLVNALLGKDVLPTDFRATTATWIRISYGDMPTAKVYIQDGSMPVSAFDIDMEDLPVYLAVQGAQRLAARHGSSARVLSVDLTVPATLLKSGLEFIDTPGVGGLRAAHRHAALAALVEADAVIFVNKPGEPLSASERLFLAEAADRVDVCIIAHTHRDQVADADQVLVDDLSLLKNADQWNALLGDRQRAARLAKRFESVPAVSVSAKNFLDATALADGKTRQTLFEASKLALLQEILDNEIVAKGTALRRRNVVRLVEILLADINARASQRRTIFHGDAQAAAALNKRERSVQRWIAQGGDHWRREFEASCDRLPAEFREFAKTRALELSQEYRQRLPTMSTDEIQNVTEQLLRAPGAELTEMIRIGRSRITAAVDRVRVLLRGDGLDEPLDRMEQRDAVFARLSALPRQDDSITFDAEDVKAALSGGMLGVGFVGTAATVLTHAGIAVGVSVPIFWPFVIGAVAFTGINVFRKQKAKTVAKALELLNTVCDEITGTAVDMAAEAARTAARDVADEISAGLQELAEEVRQARRDLAESAGLTPEQRASRVKEADEAMEKAAALRRELDGIRAEI
jgi:GTPase Era involved in 16S rRNA processing